MAFDFPASPFVGQMFQGYVWDGQKWILVSKGSVSTAASPPSNPLGGDLWWDNDIGVLFIYYQDGSSSQWVSATGEGNSGGSVFIDAPNDFVMYARRNLDWSPITSATTGLAPLASPVLTGNPQAPTPAPGDSDTSIATTAYVAAAVTAVGGVFPSNAVPLADGAATSGVSALYARGDHVHPADATRAPLASPVFTGDPKAPTPAPGDNDTSVATTAFVVTATAALAPLASPVFTGDPKAPTPAPGDNDTSIATTAYVTAAMVAAGTVNPSNANPIMNGAVAPGVSALYARGDHVHPSDTARVLRAGDSMSGDLRIVKSAPTLVLDKLTGAGGDACDIWARGSTGVPRWLMRMSDTGPESGGNAGSDFVLYNFNDAGTQIGVPLLINRANSRMSLAGDPTAALHATTKDYADGVSVIGNGGLQVNGGMLLDQQFCGGSGQLVGSATVRVCDGWQQQRAGGTFGTVFSTQIAIAAGEVPGFRYGLRNGIGASPGTVAAGEFVINTQSLEQYRVMRLGWGAAGAIPLTICFMVRALSPGLYSGSIRNTSVDRSYVFTFNIVSANTWEYKVITIPGDVTGSWSPAVNTAGMAISFACAVGTTFQKAAGSWGAGNFIGATGSTNAFAVSSGYVDLTGFMAFPGNYAPTAAQLPSMQRPYDVELLLAQRYYYKTFSDGAPPVQNGGVAGVWVFQDSGASGTYGSVTSIPFAVVMHAPPTIITYNPAAANAQVRNFSLTADAGVPSVNLFTGANTRYVSLNCTGSTAAGTQLGIHITADARL